MHKGTKGIREVLYTQFVTNQDPHSFQSEPSHLPMQSNPIPSVSPSHTNRKKKLTKPTSHQEHFHQESTWLSRRGRPKISQKNDSFFSSLSYWNCKSNGWMVLDFPGLLAEHFQIFSCDSTTAEEKESTSSFKMNSSLFCSFEAGSVNRTHSVQCYYDCR